VGRSLTEAAGCAKVGRQQAKGTKQVLFVIKGKEVLVDNRMTYVLGFTEGRVESWRINSRGYAQGWVEGRTQLLHRLIAAEAGLDVSQQIDHRNGNKLDNRLENLRPANQAENSYNQGKRKHNTSGFKGVSWSKSHQKWQATIKVNYRQKHLGYFATAEEAAAAYQEAALKYHGEFANFG
jgi:hypothetical protein